MKKSNKVIAVVLSLVLLLTAVGGTIAWLTDKDKAENVFSVGSVDIKLTEECEVNNGKPGDAKITYENKTEPAENGTGTIFTGIMPGNKIVKKPTITNEGKNDAYVRVVVEVENNTAQTAFEKVHAEWNVVDIMDQAIDSVFENAYGKNSVDYNAFYQNIFDGWGISYLKTETSGNFMRFTMQQRDDEHVLNIDSLRSMGANTWQFSHENAFMSDYEKGNATSTDSNWHGIGYFDFDENDRSYYDGLVAKNEGRLVYVFYLQLKGTDNMTGGAKDSYTLFNGFNVPEEFDTKSLAFFNGLNVNIYADAIQTEGFVETTDTDGNTVPAWKNAIEALNKQHPLSQLVAGN